MMVTQIVLEGVGEPETLKVRQGEVSPPVAGQVMIRVEATGVSFAEQGMRLNRYPGQPPFPFVPGYDLVGTVTDLGPGVTEVKVGQRVAAVTKIGGWSEYVVLSAVDLVVVPDGLDAVTAETAGVNGVTAWQMLHRDAKARAGQTIVVHGATSGVGVVLVQLAREAGVRVIGTASPAKHAIVRALGAEPLDYQDTYIVARVRALAPGGVDAVFDHVGGASVGRSWQMLAPGGTLVAYGMASRARVPGSLIVEFFRLLSRIYLWNVLPNGRHARFYNVWGGKTLRPRAFRRELHTALSEVLALLAQGRIEAQVAHRLPLEQAAEAMRLAESRSTSGKIVLVPGLA